MTTSVSTAAGIQPRTNRDDPALLGRIADLRLSLHQFDEARAEFIPSVERNPGMKADVDVDLAHLLVIERRFAEIFAERGERDAAFRWISTAYDRLGGRPWESIECQWLYPLTCSPFLVKLEGDPRWAPLAMRGESPEARELLRIVAAKINLT